MKVIHSFNKKQNKTLQWLFVELKIKSKIICLIHKALPINLHSSISSDLSVTFQTESLIYSSSLSYSPNSSHTSLIFSNMLDTFPLQNLCTRCSSTQMYVPFISFKFLFKCLLSWITAFLHTHYAASSLFTLFYFSTELLISCHIVAYNIVYMFIIFFMSPSRM